MRKQDRVTRKNGDEEIINQIKLVYYTETIRS